VRVCSSLALAAHLAQPLLLASCLFSLSLSFVVQKLGTITPHLPLSNALESDTYSETEVSFSIPGVWSWVCLHPMTNRGCHPQALPRLWAILPFRLSASFHRQDYIANRPRVGRSTSNIIFQLHNFEQVVLVSWKYPCL
jgi:hypothetical protein